MKYEVPKCTATYADTLQAIGLASLVEEISGSSVRLSSLGDKYVLDAQELPEPAEWKPIEPGYPFICVKADKKVPSGWVLDYEREREKAAHLKEFRSATGKKRDNLLSTFKQQGMESPPEPLAEYRIASFLASMRKGWTSDKDLFVWIKENPDYTASWVANYLFPDRQYTGEVPNTKNSQVFNPIAGKGVHRPKPDSTSASSIANFMTNPFEEWMKFRGTYRAMLPYRRDKDFKVFVIEPTDIHLSELMLIYKVLRSLNLWGGIKLDIEAVLRLTELLIGHSDVMGGTIPLGRRRPKDLIGGLHQAYFQNLGTAAALMNYSFTALPSWFVLNDREDAITFISIIHEHIGEIRGSTTGCLRSLNEDHSGDVPVLHQYRKWLMSGEAGDFLEFCYRFALHQMERMGKAEWVKAMSTESLDSIFRKGYFMEDIVGSDGFQSIARGIRNATVYAISFQKQKHRFRDVQFGLAQRWKQKIKGGKEEFIAALCDFVQQYNWESEKLDSATRPGESTARKNHKIRVQELDEVIALVNAKGAELVGMLLLAYGYARAPKGETAEEPKGQLEEVQ